MVMIAEKTAMNCLQWSDTVRGWLQSARHCTQSWCLWPSLICRSCMFLYSTIYVKLFIFILHFAKCCSVQY